MGLKARKVNLDVFEMEPDLWEAVLESSVAGPKVQQAEYPSLKEKPR